MVLMNRVPRTMNGVNPHGNHTRLRSLASVPREHVKRNDLRIQL